MRTIGHLPPFALPHAQSSRRPVRPKSSRSTYQSRTRTSSGTTFTFKSLEPGLAPNLAAALRGIDLTTRFDVKLRLSITTYSDSVAS